MCKIAKFGNFLYKCKKMNTMNKIQQEIARGFGILNKNL